MVMFRATYGKETDKIIIYTYIHNYKIKYIYRIVYKEVHAHRNIIKIFRYYSMFSEENL